MGGSRITGVILCGGRGRRVAGRDKGLIRVHGDFLIRRTARRLAPQVGSLRVSVNRHRRLYRSLGLEPVGDRWPDYRGPLAGLASAMAGIRTPYVATVPCDDPAFPPDLVWRLWRALCGAGADICVALSGGRLYPLHAVMKTQLRRALFEYVSRGGAGVEQWVRDQRWVALPVPPETLMNLNTLQDLRRCARKVHRS